MGFIIADRNQEHVFGYRIDDFVEKDSKCRYMLEIIEQLDLQKLYRKYSNQGAEKYDPKILLAIWFLAYCEGITSSRQVEKLCKKHMDFIYISGNLRPDHSTLCRFIQRNRELWPVYFLEILSFAKKKKVSDFKSIMIDGTKIRAKSSKKQSMREPKLNRYLERVKEDIKQYEEELGKLEGSEKVEEAEELNNKVNKLKKKESLLEDRQKELQKRKENLQAKDRKNHQINLQEEEAYMMDLGAGKGYAPGYNAQIAVDSKTQLIVSCEVVQARNDEKQFSEMHKSVENNLGYDKERLYAADSGYHSFEQVEYAVTNNVNAYIGDPKLKNYKEMTFEELQSSGQKISRPDFKYNEQEDHYTCPAGNKLEFKSENISTKERLYICKQCSECPIKDQCLSTKNKKGHRKIVRDFREQYAEVIRSKMRGEKAEEVLMTRQTTVEPVIGNMKENLGFTRFRSKGLFNAMSEYALMCIAHNLNKLYRLVFCSIFVQTKAKLYFLHLLTGFVRRIKTLFNDITVQQNYTTCVNFSIA